MAVNVGQGTILKATISASLTAIFQLLEVDGPGIEVGAKGTENLTSTSLSFRAQLPNPGTLDYTVQYDPNDTTTTVWTTTQVFTWPQPLVVWNLIFNCSPVCHWVFSAFIAKFKPKGMNQEDNLEADISLQLSGAITFTAGS